MKELTPAERVIVAADFKARDGDVVSVIESDVLNLADSIHGTGVYLKVNSALRACGLHLIDRIRSKGLKVFADLKLFDIGETLVTDASFLRAFRPELLTVSAGVGTSAMQTLREALPETEVLGVTVLTNFSDDDCEHMFKSSMRGSVTLFALSAKEAGLGGIISSAKEAGFVRQIILPDMTINTPAIRPKWAFVAGDDQNPDRSMTPAEAILTGADRVVIGRPITQHKNPRDAVMRTIDEVTDAVSQLKRTA